MSKSRIKAAADWLLEISALLVVFPVLDSLFLSGTGSMWVPTAGIVFGILSGLLGIYLTPEKEKP